MRKLTSDELALILQEGEGLTIEFKERVANLDRELVAFANASGGRIFVGISDQGDVVGVKVDNALRSRIQDIVRNCEPPLDIQLEVAGNILVVHVAEGRDKPYRCASGFYARMGPNSQKMMRSQIVDLLYSEGLVRWDQKLSAELDFDTVFDAGLLKTFLQKAHISTELSDLDVLQNLGVVTLVGGKPVLNNTGALFFGCFHKLATRFTGLTCVLYKGVEKVHILDRKDFDQDIVSNIDEAMLFLKRHLSVRYEFDGSPQRKEIPELPYEALREAVINAMTHRDYVRQGSTTTIEIFDDRVEISNPGGLMKPLTKEELGQRSILRNPLIASLMQRIEYIEKLGTGILRMRQLLEAGHCPPLQFECNDFFTSLFVKPTTGIVSTEKSSVKGSVKSSVKSSVKIFEMMQANDKITISEIAETIGLTSRAIEKQIAMLKEDGVIRRIGPDKGGHWEICKK